MTKYKTGDCFRIQNSYSGTTGFIKITDMENANEIQRATDYAHLYYLVATEEGLYAGWYSETELDRAQMLNRLEKLVLFGGTDGD